MNGHSVETCTLPLNYLGNTGLKVTNLSLGTSTFGDQKHAIGRPCADDTTAMAILDTFAAAGGNYIDTADLYSHGQAEAIVGQWLTSQDRERFVVTSKAGTHVSKSNPNALGCHRKHLVASLEKTLENLRSSYVDIFLMHRYDPMTPMEQVVRTLNDFVRCGKIRHFGVSNFAGWQLQKMVDYCQFMDLEGPCVNQVEYSLLCRGAELEVTDVCKAENISLTPWGILRGGWLSGKIQRGMVAPPSDSRIAWSSSVKKTVTAKEWSEYGTNEDFYQLIDVITDIGNRHGKTVPQVAVKWLLQQEVVPSAVIGVKSVEQLNDHLLAASSQWQLSDTEMQGLNEASSLLLPIPDNYTIVRNSSAARLP